MNWGFTSGVEDTSVAIHVSSSQVEVVVLIFVLCSNVSDVVQDGSFFKRNFFKSRIKLQHRFFVPENEAKYVDEQGRLLTS